MGAPPSSTISISSWLMGSLPVSGFSWGLTCQASFPLLSIIGTVPDGRAGWDDFFKVFFGAGELLTGVSRAPKLFCSNLPLFLFLPYLNLIAGVLALWTLLDNDRNRAESGFIISYIS